MKRLRRYLVAGLLVWIPIYVTVIVVQFVTRQLDKSLVVLPRRFQPEEWLGVAIPGFGILLTLLLLLITGLLAANFVGKSMVGYWESLLVRIPFVRAVYSSTKNFAELVLAEGGQSFKKVLLIEYPRKGVYTVAFLTSSQPGEIQHRVNKDVVCAFVATSPNPVTGFVVFVPKDEVVELDMEIDEAFKLVVSFGVVIPTWDAETAAQLPVKQPAETAASDL